MSLRFGVASSSARERFADMLALSFGLPRDLCFVWYEKAGYDNVRVMHEGDHLVGGLMLIPMGQYFGGRSVPTMGVAGVAVSPSHRGRGLASELMRRTLQELQRAGMALSTLYPASIPLYRRAGYELAGGIWRYGLASRDLPIQPLELTVRLIEEADDNQVRAIYVDQAKSRPGWMDRGPYVWERIYRERDGHAAHGHVFCDGKRIEAYLVYRLYPTPLGFEVRVSDMAARSARGYRDVVSFLGSHKSLGDELTWYGGIDDPWLALLRDRHYAVKLHHHWMLRIVDVGRALEARGYPSDVEGSLTIQLHDDVLRQPAAFRVSVEGGRATVRPGGRGGLTLDARTLAAVYSGHLDVRMAARLGRIVGSRRVVDRAAALLAGPPPSMNDLF